MKQLFQIADETGAEYFQPVLSLWIGEKHISFAISDFNSKKVKQIVWDSAEEVNDSSLEEWYSFHPEVRDDFSKIQIGYNFPQSTLVSAGDFQQDQSKEILRGFSGINDSSIIISDTLIEWQLVNTYAIPAYVHNWVIKKFPGASFKNQYTVNIKSGNIKYAGGSFIIDFRPEEFSVIVLKEGRLILAQTYSYLVPDDVIYYLMKIVHQYSFSQKEVLIQLSGLIDRQSALFKELYQYFINIEFREGEWSLPVSDYPTHFFTSLNDLAKCVS